MGINSWINGQYIAWRRRSPSPEPRIVWGPMYRVTGRHPAFPLPTPSWQGHIRNRHPVLHEPWLNHDPTAQTGRQWIAARIPRMP